MNELKYAIAYHTQHGDEYLCGLETCCYGERVIPYFSRLRATALPLSYDQAVSLQKCIQQDCRAIRFVVVAYPRRDDPNQEVSDNG